MDHRGKKPISFQMMYLAVIYTKFQYRAKRRKYVSFSTINSETIMIKTFRFLMEFVKNNI